MKSNKEKRYGTNILIASLAISGLFSITSGAVLNKIDITPKPMKIKVIEKSLAKVKSNIPVLKEITIEVNNPISVDVKDYIDNLDDIDTTVLSKFKLDTSLVNVTQKGTYIYTISYKDKKYNGTIIVKEKDLPTLSSITLKEITIEKGKELSTNISDYVNESIPDEIKNQVTLDISKVNKDVAGTYQYTIKYNDSIYTGNIIVYEPQPTTPTTTTTTTTTETDNNNNNQ